jgi:N-methylhydantoinase B
MGARPSADGLDAIETDVSNCMNIPAESIELDYPIRIMTCRLWHDSGGAGRFRGGAGLEKVFEVARGEATITYRGERHSIPPWGLFGGLPGRQSMANVVRSNGQVEELEAKVTLKLKAGDQLHIFTAGGAGYGDPLERDPDSVLQDVLDNQVSEESALSDYGVVLDLESGAVNIEATRKTQTELRTERGEVSWTYDLGAELGRV